MASSGAETTEKIKLDKGNDQGVGPRPDFNLRGSLWACGPMLSANWGQEWDALDLTACHQMHGLRERTHTWGPRVPPPGVGSESRLAV